MSERPSSTFVWRTDRDEWLERRIFGGYRSIEVLHMPPMPFLAVDTPEAISDTTAVHHYWFYLTFESSGNGNGHSRWWLRVTDHEGEVMEMRPMSNSELTYLSNRGWEG